MPWTGPTSGLIHRWPLDLANLSGGIDSDVVGTINITETGGVASSTGPTGAVDSARAFNGTGYGTFTSSPLPDTGPYTVSVWAMMPDITAIASPGGANTFLSLGTNATNHLRIVEDNGTANGIVGALAFSRTGFSLQTPVPVFANNQWGQAAVTFDGGMYQLVFDAVVVSAVGSVLNPPLALDEIAARDGAGNTALLTGSLASLAIYNRALSATELIQLYNADSSAPFVPSPLPFEQQNLLFV